MPKTKTRFTIQIPGRPEMGCDTADEILDALSELKDTKGVIVTDLQTGMKDLTREAKRPAADQIQYHPGDKVIHPKWGSGLVLNSVLQDDDEIVDIFFEDVGKKKLIASLADLKKTG